MKQNGNAVESLDTSSTQNNSSWKQVNTVTSCEGIVEPGDAWESCDIPGGFPFNQLGNEREGIFLPDN